MTKEEEVLRGNESRAILNNPLYQEAIMTLRGQMMEQFTKTTHDQSDERDEVWRTMKVLDAIERQLESIMSTGKLASVETLSTGAPH